MFEIGFSELIMVGLVSLLVIGPEQLPKAARLAGFWLGKTRRMVADVKDEIRQELNAEDMRQMLKEQTGIEDLQNVADEMNNAAHSIKSAVNHLTDKGNLLTKRPPNEFE
jgi:sec-independent protein translocase protein TatB